MPVPNANVVVPVSGAIDLWVQVGADAAPTQLGWSESGPQIEFQPLFAEIMSDRSGGMPVNRLYQGEKALVGATLTEYDAILYERLKQVPLHAAAANVAAITAGTIPRLAIGAGTAGLIKLWVRYTYFGTAYASTGLIPGYYFPSVNLVPQTIQPGSKGTRLTLGFEALPIFDAATCNWTLYSTASTLFSGLAAPCTVA